MSDDREQSFNTGPSMLNRKLAIVLLVACATLALSQWWVAANRWSAQGTTTGEPLARMLFAAVFTAAAIGVAYALLERMNATVILSDDAVIVHSWRGKQQEVPWEEITSISLLAPAGDEPELPFHWLTARTVEGGKIRLAGGPWPESIEVRSLRRELTARLGFERQPPTARRWLLMLPAQRVTWS